MGRRKIWGKITECEIQSDDWRWKMKENKNWVFTIDRKRKEI